MRTIATTSQTSLLLVLLVTLTSCGGGSNSSLSANGPLTGNWQLNMLQTYPGKARSLAVSGFLVQSNDMLSGSVQGPSILSPNGSNLNCGGTAQVTGTLSGQSVAFTENLGGTTYNFTGTISSDNQTMSGDFQAPAGACFTAPTTGTWNAFLIPPLNGSFTGTITGSTYMAALTGVSPAAPITVSGTFNQSSNAGASNATVDATINATGYPCFATASLTGTISGQNVYLDVYSYNGEQIGTLGAPSSSPTAGGQPATVILSSTGFSLVDANLDGLNLGSPSPGPCPPVVVSGGSQAFDQASVALTFQ